METVQHVIQLHYIAYYRLQIKYRFSNAVPLQIY